MKSELIQEARRQWLHAAMFTYDPYSTIPNPWVPEYRYTVKPVSCAELSNKADPARLREALMLARDYVLAATTGAHDGSGGNFIRAEAKRRLAIIDAALLVPAEPRDRRITTGRFDTRKELEEFVVREARNSKRNQSQIARAARVSATCVWKILSDWDGKATP